MFYLNIFFSIYFLIIILYFAAIFTFIKIKKGYFVSSQPFTIFTVKGLFTFYAWINFIFMCLII